MFKRVSGTKDILPQESLQWQRLEKRARQIFSLYNYLEIRTPIIEEEALFNRSLGSSTEIVRKQMFLIKKERDTYCLRPEGTAAVVRAYLENNLDKTDGFVKFYYLGAMFRAERPQKGRLRQFHHIGAEAIGSADAQVDIELIALAESLLKGFSIEGYQIQLNSLGCPEDKAKLVALLRRQLKPEVGKLCVDCRKRFKDNVLRILDCKNEGCRQIVSSLDISDKHLCQECGTHFEKVKQGLDVLGIAYKITPHLVRGLDYYTRTVFEISHPGLGAQDAIGAGGRYDGLVKELGGPNAAAMGFAFGMERLILALSTKEDSSAERNLQYYIGLGEASRLKALELAEKRRDKGLATDINLENRSLKAQMRRANDLGADKVVIIGDNELAKGAAIVKDMKSGEQKEVAFEALSEE